MDEEVEFSSTYGFFEVFFMPGVFGLEILEDDVLLIVEKKGLIGIDNSLFSEGVMIPTTTSVVVVGGEYGRPSIFRDDLLSFCRSDMTTIFYTTTTATSTDTSSKSSMIR